MKEHFLKTEESLSMKLQTHWEFYLGRFRALWKTVCVWIRFPPNLCLTPVHSALSIPEFPAKNKMNVILHSLVIRFSIIWLVSFSKCRMTLKGSSLNDTTMIHAELLDVLTEFQTMHFMKSFRWCHDCIARCVRSLAEYSWRGQHWLEGKHCNRGINSVQRLNDYTMYVQVSHWLWCKMSKQWCVT